MSLVVFDVVDVVFYFFCFLFLFVLLLVLFSLSYLLLSHSLLLSFLSSPPHLSLSYRSGQLRRGMGSEELHHTTTPHDTPSCSH